MTFLDKATNMMGLGKNPEYDEVMDEQYEEELVETAQPPARRWTDAFRSRSESPVETPMSFDGDMRIMLLQPLRLEEAQTISRGLLDGKVVVFDLQACDVGTAQDIVNFVSGTVFALGGTIQKINEHGSIFVAVPPNVSLENALRGGLKDDDYGPIVESWVNHRGYAEVE